jgi:hypothetical protein
MMLILTLMEDKMRIASTLSQMVALAFGVALAAPISALADDGAHPFHKHAIQMHRVAYAGISLNATALTPVRLVVSALSARETDGLSRNLDDCVRYGCLGGN